METVQKSIANLVIVTILFLAIILGAIVIPLRPGSFQALYFVPFSALAAVVAYWRLSRRYGLFYKDITPCHACGDPVKFNEPVCPSCGSEASPDIREFSLGDYTALLAALFYIVILFQVDYYLGWSGRCNAICSSFGEDMYRLSQKQAEYKEESGDYFPGVPGRNRPPGFLHMEDSMFALVELERDQFVYVGAHPRCDKDCSGWPEVWLLDSATFDEDKGLRSLKSNIEESLAAYAAMGDVESFKALYYETAPRLDKIMLHGKSAMELAMINERHEMIKLLEELGFPKGGNSAKAAPVEDQGRAVLTSK